MKFTMPQKELAKAIKTVLPAVSAKNTIPVLSGIHIETFAPATRSIRFTGSDLAVTVQFTTAGEVIQQGALVIEAKRLADLVNKVTGTVTIEADPRNGTAWVSWGRSKANLVAYPADQFLSVPVLEERPLSLRADRLARLLDQTLFASSHDESKPWLNGTHLRIREGKVAAYGADSIAFATWKGDLEAEGDLSIRELIPHKAGHLLCQYLPDKDVRISLGTAQQSLIFELPNITIISRTVEGQFPDLERLVPANYPTRARVNREEIIRAIERAVPFGNNSVKWSIQTGELMVSARSSGDGMIEEPVACEYLGEEPITIGFNPKLVLPGLKVFTGDTVDIELIGPKNPARFRSPADPELTYVVMPLISY